jgi:ketosteroid isomerase-like protein
VPLWVLTFLAACQPAPAALSEADRAAIQEVTDRFLVHIAAKNWDSLSVLYTEDGVIMPPNHAPVRGRAAIKEFGEAFPPLAAFAVTNDVIEGSGTLAYVLGHGVMTVEGTPPDTFKFVEVRRKEADGVWRMAVDMFSSNLPVTLPELVVR